MVQMDSAERKLAADRFFGLNISWESVETEHWKIGFIR